MKKRFMLGAVAASLVWLPPAFASDDSRIEFHGGIGSTPFALVSGAPGPNDVRGIAPGGRPWVIEKLRAAIRPDGNISVRGQGLLLAGGNSVGLPALPRQVVATLFCGATELTSPPADLDASGNFMIRGTLGAALPEPCQTPTLLIRNFSANAAGAWFAAGIPEN
ncbi:MULTISPECIES: hypothetical protein [unclassified Polaromonas]|uniref:hypothetical protein n=1 Tax=unclassified Polaromonas TaxID=2638319 RepID=UPI0018C96F59|nr:MULTISPECIES: hypothetical protein [unclassified Polaromonas]MBG6073950.1 hypothetical protein [Polaromonas sp. CG_9.7]MBG6115949.1 hypothetical protein [Polaromonas sp. CG_9.2]MDH6183528.1 hypothetical protein [Polaromonas sp. CG_23.6]